MERGLLWLPLLAVFIWLAWAGWREYQKVEAYQAWSANFERAKYDIYAVLGQQGNTLTWGKPTRKGPVDLATFSLQDVQTIRLLVNGQVADLNNPPSSGQVVLEFICTGGEQAIAIPFTEVSLAAKWGLHLQAELARLQPFSRG